jgi:hypothetical protein
MKTLLLTLLATLATAFSTSSCEALMTGPQGFENGMRRAEVKRDVLDVWYRSKEVMGILSSTPITVSEEVPRTIEGTVEGAKVNVRIMAWDLGRTRIEVRAREFGLPDEPVADRVLATLVERTE